MTALEQYIHTYFGIMQPDDLQTLMSLFQVKTIPKGDFLLRAGRDCDHLSFVQSGLLRMFIATEDKDITQWISSPGSFTTDLSSFVFHTPARLSIQALTETQVYLITRDDYRSIGDKVRGWHELEKLFLVRCFIQLEARIFTHLSMTAEERYAAFFQHHKELFHEVPLQYIASMLGMTPETFSRIRRKQLS